MFPLSSCLPVLPHDSPWLPLMFPGVARELLLAPHVSMELLAGLLPHDKTWLPLMFPGVARKLLLAQHVSIEILPSAAA